MTGHGAAEARQTADAIRAAVASAQPDLAIIAGSGFAGLTAAITGARSIDYASLPHFPAPTVAGHAGRVVAGAIRRASVVVFEGRVHQYEGYGADAAAFIARVAHALGARALLVTNAAGGIQAGLAPGDLMVINDHVNFTFRNPLTGPIQPGDVRFPDMSAPYDADLTARLLEAARAASPRASRGVYAGVLGPSYETPAEIRALARLGVDAVGMSTVAEVIVARSVGLPVAGLSVIANLASGTAAAVAHADVLNAVARASDAVRATVTQFASDLAGASKG